VLGDAAGCDQAGLNWIRRPAGKRGSVPHCHSAESEAFVILEGSGTLELWPTPRLATQGTAVESHALRPGHVVARPPGTRVGHSVKAGDEGITYLVYGTRDPNDICYYPRSNKIAFRGVGVLTRLENLDYWDGETIDE
jgi:uncharacterized cupin superfamily protein